MNAIVLPKRPENYVGVWVNGELLSDENYTVIGDVVHLKHPPSAIPIKGIGAWICRIIGRIIKREDLISKGMTCDVVIAYSYLNGSTSTPIAVMADGTSIR